MAGVDDGWRVRAGGDSPNGSFDAAIQRPTVDPPAMLRPRNVMTEGKRVVRREQEKPARPIPNLYAKSLWDTALAAQGYDGLRRDQCRWSMGTKTRFRGPTYSARGRINRLSAYCSSTWADHPLMRLTAKTGVNRSIGIPSA